MQNLKNKLAVVAVSLIAAAPAMAAGETSFDPSTYVTQISGTIAGILAVGAAVFGVLVAIKSTKWARRAL
jgi:hypothetical protein